MGTFIGHFAPSTSFTLLGLWHLFNTTSSTSTTSTTWFPSPFIKHLELYLILSLSLLAIPLQFIPTTQPLSPLPLEHATMFLHLAVYASSAIAVDLSPSPSAFSGLVAALAASAFGQELFLLHFHSADHVGLEGHYHFLLQLIVAASMGFTAVAASSAGFAVARSAAVVCQGLWFGIMGVVLWVPGMAPEGCGGGGQGAAECATEEAGRRAAALANLQFSWMIAGVLILTVCICLRKDWKWMEYRKLEDGGEGNGVKQVHGSV